MPATLAIVTAPQPSVTVIDAVASRTRSRTGRSVWPAPSVLSPVVAPVGSAIRGLEVDLLAHAAVGAGPVVRDLGPGRARGEALARVAGLLVVRVAAAGTDVPHRLSSLPRLVGASSRPNLPACPGGRLGRMTSEPTTTPPRATIGLTGLAVMGRNLARNI